MHAEGIASAGDAGRRSVGGRAFRAGAANAEGLGGWYLLRRALCRDALATLEALSTGAGPARALFDMAAEGADRLRRELSDVRADDGSRPEACQLEELRCHMHDTTLQVLEFIACGGYGLCQTTEEIAATARRAADDLRGWLAQPCETKEPRDLFDDLRRVVDDARRFGLSHVLLQQVGPPPPVEPTAAEAISAAVREALTNVRKHARAATVRVRVCSEGDAVEVSVLDDGVGMADDAKMGIGLPSSIFNRIDRAGGTATIASSEGLGTEVRIVLGRTA